MTPREIAASRRLVTTRLEEIRARRQVIDAELVAIIREEATLMAAKTRHEEDVFIEIERENVTRSPLNPRGQS